MSDFVEWEQSIWVVAAALYVAACVRRTSPSAMLFVESHKFEFRAAISLEPYVLGGRALQALPLVPYLGGFEASTLVDVAPNNSLRRTLHRVRYRQRAVLPFRITGSASFLAMFVVGPTLTATSGLLVALLIAGSATYSINLLSCCIAWRRRAQLELTRTDVGLIALEVLLCAPYGAALVKRLWLLPNLAVSGVTLCKPLASAADQSRLEFVLSQRLKE